MLEPDTDLWRRVLAETFGWRQIGGVTRLIEAQAIRFKRDYLLRQIILRPFPAQLSDLSDSGKGREVT